MIDINKETVLWGLAGVAGAYFLGKYMINDAGESVVETVNQNLNPTEQTNLANRAFNAVYSGGLDGKGTLGTDIYDTVQAAREWFNGTAVPWISPKAPPEASTLPNSWHRDTPGPSGRAPVTKGQTGIIGTITGWFE